MEKQYSMRERWAMDAESFEKGASFNILVPQCDSCTHFEAKDIFHCAVYVHEQKPKDVMFANKECSAFDSRNPLIVNIQNENQNRLYGGIFGFCIGDILGVPVEFSSRYDRDRDAVNEMRAYGTYRQPFGAWSDSSSLMFCLMDAMANGFSWERLRDNMIGYYTDGLFTAGGQKFDTGVATSAAIENMMKGVEMAKCGRTQKADSGNGSLMRILPLAFVSGGKSAAEIIKMVSDVSSITHANRRSILGCLIYTLMAKGLYEGNTKENALDMAIDFVKRNCRDTSLVDSLEYRDILRKTVVDFDRSQVRSTGYVVDTLEAVIWAFMNSDSYREAVLKAVNLGGDTDTIAALVGGLAGIFYGFCALPNGWIQSIIKKEWLCDLVKQFESVVSGSKE